MKKLSVLVALILCVTIGSVYATWFYAETAMRPAEHEFKNLGITDVNTSAQTGQIAVTDTLILKIDDNTGNHIPDWDTDVTENTAGNIKIVFTPNSGAADTSFKCTFTIKNNIYNGRPIFTFTGMDDDAEALVSEQQISETDFSYTAGAEKAEKIVTLESITSRLEVNEIPLPTIAEYNAYKDALDSVVLKLTITEVVETTAE